jgi:glycosidase
VVPFVALDFWADFRQTVKRANPEAVLLAEIWGDASLWLDGTRFDGTMNYTFRALALDYFARASLETPAFLDGIAAMLRMYAPQAMFASQNLLSSHDVPRFLHEAGGDSRRFRLATLFQLTLPGAPSIYYGDEIGLSGAHDPDNRRAFPWDSRDTWDAETLSQTRTLIHLRREHPALQTGDWQLLWADEEAFAYRRFDAREQVIVVIAREKEISGAVIPVQLREPRLIFGEADFRTHAGKIEILQMEKWSGAVFVNEI